MVIEKISQTANSVYYTVDNGSLNHNNGNKDKWILSRDVYMETITYLEDPTEHENMDLTLKINKKRPKQLLYISFLKLPECIILHLV